MKAMKPPNVPYGWLRLAQCRKKYPSKKERPFQTKTVRTAPGRVAAKRCFTFGARKYSTSTARIVEEIASVQRRAGHTATKRDDNRRRPANQSPKRGPTIITAKAHKSNVPIIAPRAIARRRVFQKGRSSQAS